MSTKKILLYGAGAALVAAVVFKVKLPGLGFIGSGPTQDGKNPTGVVRGSA
jgi:hypothetical protein